MQSSCCKLDIPGFSLFFDSCNFSEFKFSGWNVLDTFAWMTPNQGVNMVINLFWGTVVNAARGMAGQIQVAISSLCSNLVIALRPQLVQSYADGNLIHYRSGQRGENANVKFNQAAQ